MTEELYKKYRPKSFRQMVGQEAALKPLVAMGQEGKLPHAILLTGPSGVGKTTAARILRKKLKCGDQDFYETNGAQVRGIDSIRDITKTINFAPISGNVRVWLIDECAKITSDGADALLKVLEDTPQHAYFFLCTTDPQKLKRTLETRCHLVEFKPIPDVAMGKLIAAISSKEKISTTCEVIDEIIDCSEGSARQALVFLHAIANLKTPQEQLDAISKGAAKAVGLDIARALHKGVSWKQMGKLLKGAADEEAESIRWVVLGYAKAVLLSEGDTKSAHILECFRDNFFDSKHNGLALACWEVLKGK